MGQEWFLRENGQVVWRSPGWQWRGVGVRYLIPLLSLEGRAAKEEHNLAKLPSRIQSRLRQEDSDDLHKAGSVSPHIFLRKSNLLFICFLRSLSLARGGVPFTLDGLMHFLETLVFCIKMESKV